MSSQIPETEWIWRNGEWIRWRDATIHVLSHSVQFGGALFEGIRCYATPEGPAIFRLHEHLRRLQDSCRIFRTEMGYSAGELADACRELVRRNGLESCYLRPMVVRGYGAIGMVPTASPTETYLICWPWGPYLGADALEAGVDVCVSSWQRAAPNTYPALAKVAGNYLNSQLAKLEALADGYAEAISLGADGRVSEGTGQNLFLVRDGILITPVIDGTLLAGITRDSIVTLAGELGIPVREQPVPREMLYAADELFFTGTAAEVTPIRSVDRIPVGAGGRGPITRVLQERFLGLVRGEIPDPLGWLTPVGEGATVAARD
ncbi:MAG: branched-chain amino acid transaminase [Gemmatimonadota bacterium]|nr:branched-chain amino acid transaminase [Gemmatimonadota bacterium]